MLHRLSQQPLRGHQPQRYDKLVERGATAPLGGNIIQATTSTGTTTYEYDPLDRLKSEAGPVQSQNFGYDLRGNRTSDASGTHTYTPNTDRAATIAGQSVTLDAAGHITQLRNLGFVWNPAGQLKEVHQANPTGPLLASYEYDGRGRRSRKTTTSAPQGAGTTIYLYDQYNRPLVEADGNGNPLITYAWRDEVPVSLTVHGNPESVLYLETDHLDTPRVARNQNQTVVWRWDSDAFGSTAAKEDPDGDGQATTINLRFAGQYFDQESGLHYNWHRYYDPKLGRYLSPDPIGLEGGINLYSYVDGNPLSYVDPMGLEGTGFDCIGCHHPPPLPPGTKFQPPSDGNGGSGDGSGAAGGGAGSGNCKDCHEHYVGCLGSSLADRFGSVFGSSRCQMCNEACNRGGGHWPSEVATTKGSVRCDYWNH